MLQTKKAAAEACGVERKKNAAQISREAAAVTADSQEVLFVQICAVFTMAIVAFLAIFCLKERIGLKFKVFKQVNYVRTIRYTFLIY